MSLADEELVIFPNRATVMTIVGLLLTFLALSLLLVAWPEAGRVSPWGSLLFAYLGAPFFAVSLVYVVAWWLRHRPLLVISRAGIVENVTSLRRGLIPWEDITEVYVAKFLGQRFLRIVPRDLDALLAHRSPAVRLVLKLNYGLFRTPINIGEKLLPIPMDRLLAEITRHRRG